VNQQRSHFGGVNNVTTRFSHLNLGRVGAATAAIVAILGLAACTQPAPANTATNAAGLAPANATLGALTPGGPIAPPPGGAMGGAPGAMGGAPGAMGGAPGAMGGAPGATGGAPGAMGGAPGAMGGAPGAMGGTPGAMGGPAPAAGGGDAWDQATYSSCVPSAEQNGASPQGAQRYCACVVSALDTLGPQRKEALTAQSPELMQAANYCRPQAQG
jgi:hypothetical protein